MFVYLVEAIFCYLFGCILNSEDGLWQVYLCRPVGGQVKGCVSHPVYDMIYLLIAVGLTPGGSSKLHIYTQIIHRTERT